MPALILYLLKVNIALLLFYLAYHFVLRRLTFYHLNRLFLVFGVLFSVLYPFIELSGLLSQHEELAVIYTYTAIPAWAPTVTPTPAQTTAFDYWLIPVVLFWLGTAIMAGRLLLQFFSLFTIHRASEPDIYQGISFRKISGIREAFSFWQTIYLNPAPHKEEELKSILRHEFIHVKGWHTLDVLLAELSTVLYWFNPGGWLMKKAMKENLEFIADQHVMYAGTDRKAYQYLLLKAAGTSEPQLANQFNFPSIKRRILMMNKKQSSLMHVARYAVLVPLIVAPILFIACSEEDAGVMSPGLTADTTKEQHDMSVEGDIIPDIHVYIPDASTAPEDYKAFLKRNPEIEQVGWEIKVTDGAPEIRIFMNSEPGIVGMYDLNDEKSVSAAEAKFGKIPALPAAAPLTTESSFEVIPGVEAYIPDALTAPEDYKAFLKRNPEVKHMGWISGLTNDTTQRSIVIELKSGGSDIYDLHDESSVSAAEAKYGKLPVLPPPPVPSKQELPLPPPTKHSTPLFPAGTTAKLIEDENAMTYILWPGEFIKREFAAAEKAFKESGFDLKLDGQFNGYKLANLKISLSFPETGDKANAVYTAASLQSLKEANNVAVIKADKKTQELIIGNTIAP